MNDQILFAIYFLRAIGCWRHTLRFIGETNTDTLPQSVFFQEHSVVFLSTRY